MDQDWFPRLTNAPILEAFLDVWVANLPDVTLNRLKQLHNAFIADYPECAEIPLQQFQVTSAPGEQPTMSTAVKGVRGYRFTSSDGKTLVQSRIDGFTFNNLQPYKDWHFFSSHASDAWQKYRTAFSKGQITRISLKYVNLIKCPLDGNRVALEEYFTAAPKGPYLHGGEMSNFLTQVQFDTPAKLQAIWTMTRHLPPEKDFFKVLLDIEVFTQDQGILQGENPLSVLPEMRNLKNQLFFHSLTAKGVYLFQ
jgi:uncharacterized protein (TIGR04255 family)